MHEVAAETRQRKDLLDHHRTGEQGRGGGTEKRHHGQERARQYVARDEPEPTKALGPGRHDVASVEHFGDAAPGQAHERGGVGQRQGDRRQHEMFPGGIAASRQPPEGNREHENQHGCNDDGRQRKAERGTKHKHAVPWARRG